MIPIPESTCIRAPCFPVLTVTQAGNFNDKVVMIVITNYGVRGRVDNHFYNHYSLLKTIEAAFDPAVPGPRR